MIFSTAFLKKLQYEKSCLECGETIKKKHNESLSNWENRHKFCSIKCSAIFRNFGVKTRFSKERNFVPKTAIKKGQNLSPNTQFKKGIVPWSKLHPEMMPTPWNKGKRFDEISGENHHNWKGGVSKLSARIRHLPEMKKWRMEVFKRDNYTCQEKNCGRKRKPGDRVKIEAHHVKMFSLILKENEVNSLQKAYRCKELWDISNGITLCKECHVEITRILNR